MANYSGKDQTLTFNSATFGSGGTCINSVDYSIDGDVFDTDCAGGSTKGAIAGQSTITATVNGLASQTDSTLLETTIAFGATATDWQHDPAGSTSTYTRIDTGSSPATATITSLSFSAPVNGLVAFAFTARLDDIRFTTVP